MRGESLVSRPGSRQSTAVSLLPIVCIPGGRGLPECPLLRIRQEWPQVDGRHLLMWSAAAPCGYVQLLQLGNPDPLWQYMVITASNIIYAKICNNPFLVITDDHPTGYINA